MAWREAVVHFGETAARAAMQKLILKCHLSPGDIVMLTGAVRDLHRLHPGKFLTDVRTLCPALWEHHPFITPLDDSDATARRIECSYPLIDVANTQPVHCLHGFTRFLADVLGVPIYPTEFKGAVFLSNEEKCWMSQAHELAGLDLPFWILVAGGKFDVTIKWWDSRRFQQVVDYFEGKIQFVQVGANTHYHPPIRGVIDLRGRTDLRQLVRLMYHAQGVLCPVTAVMHLAAAVESKPGSPVLRPAVVVGGGREPAYWESYPHHQFIHTNGALPCSQLGGCWKDRTHPLDDGDERDLNLCSCVSNDLPRCMDLISADEVIRRIDLYFKGSALEYLSPIQSKAAAVSVQRTRRVDRDPDILSTYTARAYAEAFIRTIPEYPDCFVGGGIVICAGGRQYLPCAWVCINMLRKFQCSLPIELWHLGPAEIEDCEVAAFAGLGVRLVDAHEVRRRHPARILRGWELKPYAILHSSFENVLLLDADNVPVKDPTFLLHCREFHETGAIFWPDYGRLHRDRPIWNVCGVAFRDEPEFETGQIVVNKRKAWKALSLCMWYNEHSDFYYGHVHGDKETFHMAFRKTGTPYAMPLTPLKSLEGVMCQHDFGGQRVFQHRNSHKWTRTEENRHIDGFWFEDECLRHLACYPEKRRELMVA